MKKRIAGANPGQRGVDYFLMGGGGGGGGGSLFSIILAKTITISLLSHPVSSSLFFMSCVYSNNLLVHLGRTVHSISIFQHKKREGNSERKVRQRDVGRAESKACSEEMFFYFSRSFLIFLAFFSCFVLASRSLAILSLHSTIKEKYQK